MSGKPFSAADNKLTEVAIKQTHRSSHQTNSQQQPSNKLTAAAIKQTHRSSHQTNSQK
jgi:hypothetical protein